MATAQFESKKYLMVAPEDLVVDPKNNPRTGLNEDNVEQIFQSLDRPNSDGITVPLEARKEGDTLVLFVGFHRCEAAIRYNKHNKANPIKVPVIVRNVNAEDAFARAITDNHNRKQMNAMDDAYAQKMLMDAHGWAVEKVAVLYGWEVEKVTNVSALLRLPKAVQKLVAKKELPVITAIEMAKTMTPEEMATALAGAERIGKTGRIKGESIRKAVKAKKAETNGKDFIRGRKELISLLEGLTGPAEPETLARTAKILLQYAAGKYKDEADAETRLRAAHGETTPRPKKETSEPADKPKTKAKKKKSKADDTPARFPSATSEDGSPEPVESPDETPEPV